MGKSKECEFCRLKDVQKRKIASNDLSWAFLTKTPITVGHSLVVPNRCVSKIADLKKEEWLSLLELVLKVQKNLEKILKIKDFNIAWNEGFNAGQTIPHLHIHIVPRKKGDSGIYNYEPRKFLYRPGKREEWAENDLEHLAFQIKNS